MRRAACGVLGMERIFKEEESLGDFLDLLGLNHPARHLLSQYRHRGAPVVLSEHRCRYGQRRASLERVPHKSTMARVLFLKENFPSVVGKGQWVILPYLVDNEIPGLSLIP